jgi:uncharacterized protein (TIGR03086 family)
MMHRMNPTQPTIDLNHTDPRATFAEAVALGTTVIAAVRADQLGLATPCDEMNVQQLLGHLVMVLQRVACAWRGEDPSTWPADLVSFDEVDAAVAWHEAAHDVEAAWTDDALLERPTRLPWTTVSGAEMLAIYTSEVTVHTWDLARATGQHPKWSDDVVEVALAAVHAELPIADRTEFWENLAASLPPAVPFSAPFASAVDIADDAPLIDRLAAWNGRTP